MSQITSYVITKYNFLSEGKTKRQNLPDKNAPWMTLTNDFKTGSLCNVVNFLYLNLKKKFVRKSENKNKSFSVLLPFPVWATCTHSSLHESRSLSGCSGTIEIPSIASQLILTVIASKDGQSWIETLSVFLRASIQLIQLMLSRSKGKRSNTSAKSLLEVAIKIHKTNKI